jgi:hypothetical protein
MVNHRRSVQVTNQRSEELMSRTTSNSARIAITLLLITPLGCKARELGATYADTQSMTVDDSWANAVESCWPALAQQGYSQEAVKHYLADPLHFRAAFAVYAQFSDASLRSMVTAPVSSAPAPDTSVLQKANSPLLTRTQAAAGVTSSSNRVPSLDSLCSIQPGLPVGFR